MDMEYIRQKPVQQGDVIFHPLSELPDGAKKVVPSGQGYVLVEGEATGHAHIITETSPDVVEVYQIGDTQFVVCNEDVPVFHLKNGQPTGDHDVNTLFAGVVYDVGRVEEFDHLTEEARAVQD